MNVPPTPSNPLLWWSVGEWKNSLANNNFNFPFSVNLWFSSEGGSGGGGRDSGEKIVCGGTVSHRANERRTTTKSGGGQSSDPFTTHTRGGWLAGGGVRASWLSDQGIRFLHFAASHTGCNCIFINLLNPLIKRILIFPAVYHLPLSDFQTAPPRGLTGCWGLLGELNAVVVVLVEIEEMN